MKTLSHYEKFEEPIILRGGLVSDSRGVGYHGSRLKATNELFKTHYVQLADRFKRP
jgi:hypothetical protein